MKYIYKRTQIHGEKQEQNNDESIKSYTVLCIMSMINKVTMGYESPMKKSRPEHIIIIIMITRSKL